MAGPPRKLREQPQIKDIKQWIDDMPARALPDVLTCIIKNCVRKGIFGQRSVAGVAQALESRFRTGLRAGHPHLPSSKSKT